MEHFVYYMRWAGISIISLIGIVVLCYSWSIETQSAVHQIYAQLVSLTGVVIIGVSIICDALLHIEGKMWQYFSKNSPNNESSEANK